MGIDRGILEVDLDGLKAPRDSLSAIRSMAFEPSATAFLVGSKGLLGTDTCEGLEIFGIPPGCDCVRANIVGLVREPVSRRMVSTNRGILLSSEPPAG